MIKNLSIILPLFNEAKRLEKTFKEIESFKQKVKNKKLEIFFIDDGSNDNSFILINSFKKKNSSKNFKIKYFKLQKNMGKGYALKKGIKMSSKSWVLTTDIDLSVPLTQILEWEKYEKFKKEKVFFGSRNLPNSKVRKKFIRFLLGTIFNFLIKLILNIELLDTQCGFKLYEKSVAKKVFSKLSNYGFAHDLELVLICKSRKIKIRELPVKWTHRSGSKVNILYDPLIMFLNIFLIRIKHRHLIT